MNASWIDKWQGSRVFVVGDVMLDKFVYGHVERVSPEVPIPALRFQSEKAMLGGAANVARNVVALGGEAVLAGIVGADAAGDIIVGELASADGIEARLVRLVNHPTTVKTRFVSGGQQIMRLDVETMLCPDVRTIETICADFADAGAIAAVVLSDYAKGILAPNLIRRIVDIARRRRIPVVADPKSRDVGRYAGVSVLTPNAAEAALITGIDCSDDASAGRAAQILREIAEVDAVALTRGAEGRTICDSAGSAEAVVHIATVATEVFDVSGAGDTVAAALSLALSQGVPTAVAARIANAAASIAVGKHGTAVVHARELARKLGGGRENDDPKIVANETAAEVVADWKAHGLKVGFTNGCFDLLHPGRVELLRRARASCDRPGGRSEFGFFRKAPQG